MPNNNEFVSGPVYNPSTFNNYGNDINFNSTEFLLDTELFGQVVLDSGNNFQSYLSQQELIPTDSSTSFQQQQQQQ
ncbi:hypothetical protein G6F56_009437 [Rhizopus delemar]|nr:hypothetical protein G6F56_009437 [Rhizopus delemar]